MTTPGPRSETEVKVPVASAAQARRLLRRAGFRRLSRRTLEANTIFDTPSDDLKKRDAVLRLRRFGPKTVLTFKGPAAEGKHKTRTEAEIEISDNPTAAWILEQLGFRPVFRYEKYRTIYSRTGGGGFVFLDETPIGSFLELEGSTNWIERVARALGLKTSAFSTETYPDLYRKYRKKHPQAPKDMVFARCMPS
jgi:adenylate cyclase class 2